jgi:hypothetical protein
MARPTRLETTEDVKRLHVLVSSDEKASFQSHAEAFGFLSVSDYVRWLDATFSDWVKSDRIPDGARLGSGSSQHGVSADPALVYELNKQGVNLMQLLKRVNQFEHVGDEELRTVLSKIEALLDKALFE